MKPGERQLVIFLDLVIRLQVARADGILVVRGEDNFADKLVVCGFEHLDQNLDIVLQSSLLSRRSKSHRCLTPIHYLKIGKLQVSVVRVVFDLAAVADDRYAIVEEPEHVALVPIRRRRRYAGVHSSLLGTVEASQVKIKYGFLSVSRNQPRNLGTSDTADVARHAVGTVTNVGRFIPVVDYWEYVVDLPLASFLFGENIYKFGSA